MAMNTFFQWAWLIGSISFFTYVVGQRCVEIKRDWPICGGLAGKSVDMDLSQNLTNFAGVLTSSPAGTTSMSDNQILQQNLAIFFDINSSQMPNGVNATFVPMFKSLHGCPKYTHYHRRYLYSMWCIVLVYSSSKCNAVVQPLCRDACQKYIDGTVTTLRNETQCPPGSPAMINLAQTLQDTANVCDRPVFNGSPGNCISGDTIEPDLCGYIPNARECDPRKCPDGNPLCVLSATSSNSSNSGNSMSTLKWIGVGLLSVSLLAAAAGVLYFIVIRRRQKKKPLPSRPLSKRVSSMLPMSQPPSDSIMVPSDAPAYYAIREYIPKMEDELALEEGDVILVIEEFDDGWVKAMNERTGSQGVCPLTFLEPLDDEMANIRRSTMYSNASSSVYSTGQSYMDSRISVQNSRLTTSSTTAATGQQPYMENIMVNKLRARETTMREDDE
ncbi:hypothetical protein HMI54_010986 [Coelomomyces lativittatus]|nr:hypothetical protein HMI56_007443 [Coelomomyces lativittatus]KAJ1516062.1 hypothetical protein HMI54_010986 [Coelomomyces lativittatus]KAJ1516412.1 hypothetical protein HMI55_002323 [Coelomomyces lativittatus]